MKFKIEQYNEKKKDSTKTLSQRFIIGLKVGWNALLLQLFYQHLYFYVF